MSDSAASKEVPMGQSAAPPHHRSRELNFCAAHPEVFADLADQWVAVERETILAFGFDLVRVVREAREKGVRVPFVFRVERAREANWGRLGL